MNIENLIKNHKQDKIGNPISAICLADIEEELIESIKNTLLQNYKLDDEKYATKEAVFYQTRRIVGKTCSIKTEKQLYTDIDFDYQLLDIVKPLMLKIQNVVPNSQPTLVQLATLLPGQKLNWHIDTFLYQQFSNKIHIPIFTNENSFYDVFINDVKRIHLSKNKIWNINNMDLHRSINAGDSLRTHLIIDFIDNNILDILNQEGINYFHHRLEFMSEKENLQLTLLKEKYFSKI